MANILGLANYVQQQGELGRARGTEQRLNRLVGQAVAAPDPESRNALVQQAVATDRQAGLELQDRLEKQDDARGLRARNAAKFVLDAWNSGTGDNAAAANNAYQMVRPFLVEEGRRYGKEPPPEFDPGMIQNIEAIVAMNSGAAGAGSNIQSTYVDADGNRVAIFRDGTSRVLGPNNASIRVLEPEGSVPYGVVTSGGRAGQMVSIGGGAPAAQPPAMVAGTAAQDDAVAARANAYYQRLRSAGLDNETAMRLTDEYLGDMGFQPAPSGPAAASPAPAPAMRPPVVFDPINGGIQQPPRTPTSAEKAAATEAAKLGVQLEYAPRMAAAEAEATRLNEQAKAEAEAAAKGSQQRAERDATLRLYEAAMEGLREGLSETDTGPVVGRIPAFTTGQQIAEGAVAAMAPVLKQLFRVAGEGTFTDKDQELLLRMVPTRTDSREARLAKIDNIDRIVRAKLGQPVPAARNGRGASGPTPGTVEDGYRFRGGDPSDPRNWERL